MRKIGRKILSGLLCGALIIGLVPGFGSEVKAADYDSTIKASELSDGQSLNVSKDTTLVMDKDLTLEGIYHDVSGISLTIKGDKKLTVKRNIKKFNKYTQESGTDVTVEGDDFWNENIEIKSGANLTLTSKNSVAGDYVIDCESLSNAGNISITSEKEVGINCHGTATVTFNGGTTRISTSARPAIIAKEISFGGKQYIKTPDGGTVGVYKEDDGNYYDIGVGDSFNTILDKEGNVAKNVVITDKPEEAAPEEAAEETPTQENTSDSGKKSYKNEWVNGQWYDANGKTDYKYKGGWKVNATGWWYEDENGWFPTNMWQKIDGDWYFFHEDGYMAENEYAGKWAAYSEGYWWVGSDGRWDGSEPGVWRLVGTKWWFKDSTGWYAKGKWYKIGGKWYEFDNDGWWIEPE